MVFVGVGEHEAEQIAALLHQELNVGQDQIDAGKVIASERNAEVDRNPLPATRIAEPIDREIHADLAHSAQRRENEPLAPNPHRLLPRRDHGGPCSLPSNAMTSPAETTALLPSGEMSTRQPASSSASKRPTRS